MRYESALSNSNLKAFLDTLAYAEGTNLYKDEDQYKVKFGSTPNHPRLISSFADHPRELYKDKGFPQGSDAAGRYQFMSKTWDELKGKLGLTDFSPFSQDLACCELISERNALNNVCNGNFEIAVKKCNTIWASLPDSPYGQPTHPMEVLEKYYISRGGQIIP